MHTWLITSITVVRQLYIDRISAMNRCQCTLQLHIAVTSGQFESVCNFVAIVHRFRMGMKELLIALSKEGTPDAYVLILTLSPNWQS